MKVKLVNRTEVNKFVDLKGKGDPDEIIVLGPRATAVHDLPSESRFISLSKEFRNQVIIRKL